MKSLSLNTSDLRTGAPILLTVSAQGGALPKVISVVPLEARGAEPFTLPVLERSPTLGTTEFTLLIPGSYRAETKDDQLSFFVVEQRNLTFDKEFGLWALLVSLSLTGVLLWTRKKKAALL